MNTNFLGILFAFIGFFVFSMVDGSSKYFFNLSTISMNFDVFFFYKTAVIALTALFAGIYKNGVQKTLQIDAKMKHILVKGVLIGITSFSATKAVTLISLNKFFAIVFTMPAMIIIMSAIFLKEKPTKDSIASVFAGFVGILIITHVWSNHDDFRLVVVVGILLSFATAFFDSLSSVYTRKYLREESILKMYFYGSIMVCILMFPFVYKYRDMHVTFAQTSFIIYFAILTNIGNLFFTRAYQLAPGYIISHTQYSQMLWGILLDYFVFFSEISMYTIIGALIIVSANLYGLIKTRDYQYE